MQPKKNGTSNDWLRIADLKGRMQRSPKSIKNCRSNDGCVGGAVRKPVAHYVLSALLNQTGLALVLSCQPRFFNNQNLREMIGNLICQSLVSDKRFRKKGEFPECEIPPKHETL